MTSSVRYVVLLTSLAILAMLLAETANRHAPDTPPFPVAPLVGLTGNSDQYIVTWDVKEQRIQLTDHIPANVEVCILQECHLVNGWLQKETNERDHQSQRPSTVRQLRRTHRTALLRSALLDSNH